MKQVLFATENESKVNRFKDALLKYDIQIISLNDIEKKVQVEETGKNAIENALIKAEAYANYLDLPVFAMDDTLFIDGVALEIQPGTNVRRVNNKRLTDEEMINYYTELVKTYGKNGKLTCRWVYGLAIINGGTPKTFTWSKDDFYLVDSPSSKINPGYPLNSISINKKLNKYFTDMTLVEQANSQANDDDAINFLYKNLI